jgi:hypothetical protein
MVVKILRLFPGSVKPYAFIHNRDHSFKLTMPLEQVGNLFRGRERKVYHVARVDTDGRLQIGKRLTSQHF